MLSNTVVPAPKASAEALEEKKSDLIFVVENVDEIAKKLESFGLKNEETALFIDFDLTLADLKPEIMSDRNAAERKNFIQSLKELKGKELVEAAYKKQQYSLLEGENTAEFVRKMHREYQSFVFTARRTGKPYVSSPETTQDGFKRTLNNLGLDFSRSFLSDQIIPLEVKNAEELENPNLVPYEAPGNPMFHQGTIFSNNLKKGSVLEAFINVLRSRGKNITTIIVIDDDGKKNLPSMKEACERMSKSDSPLRFIGFQYIAALKKVNTFTKETLAIQQKYLIMNDTFLSDEEAHILHIKENDAASIKATKDFSALPVPTRESKVEATRNIMITPRATTELKSIPEKRLTFYDKPYKDGHWALHIPTIADKNFIATLKINGVKIGLKLNQTDARGYRGSACLMADSESKMVSTFNRDYSINEKLALNAALSIFAGAYENHGIIAQISIAGNNSQSVNPDGSVQIGNEKEPSLLHGHIIGRGNPETAYIGNVALKGPKAGSEMNLRGDGSDEGNKSKEKWKDGDMEIVAKGIANEIVKILRSSPELRKIEIVSIRQNNASKRISSKSLASYGVLVGAAVLAVGVGTSIFMRRSGNSSRSLALASTTPRVKL